MADYAMVKDPSGNVCGLWLRDPAVARNCQELSILLITRGLPDSLGQAALAGKYRVVPNTYDGAGGCFVMFGSAHAPGEEAAPAKKWWQFWN